MNKETQYRNKGVPVIQDNGYGGCLYISEDTCYVELQQQDMVMIGNNWKNETIGCSLIGDIDKGLLMLVANHNVAAGAPMLGELRVYKRHSPMDPDDPLLFMVMDENGVPKKDEQGRYEWSIIEYVEEEMENY